VGSSGWGTTDTPASVRQGSSWVTSVVPIGALAWLTTRASRQRPLTDLQTDGPTRAVRGRIRRYGPTRESPAQRHIPAQPVINENGREVAHNPKAARQILPPPPASGRKPRSMTWAFGLFGGVYPVPGVFSRLVYRA
jgi:hypothetical protein